MEVEAIQRARARITALRTGETSKAELSEVVTRARVELEELTKTAAELKVTVPEQVSTGIREAIRTEVLPVARHIAEIRGLSTQVVKRIERAQSAIEAERAARIDDLDVLVDLLVSNWHGLDTRLSRIEAQLAANPPQGARATAPSVGSDAEADATEGEISGQATGDTDDAALSAVNEPPHTSAVG